MELTSLETERNVQPASTGRQVQEKETVITSVRPDTAGTVMLRNVTSMLKVIRYQD